MSRELSEFLIELSIGVHRHAMYPAGHPSLDPAVESIVSRLAEIFVDRPSIEIGVARAQLVVDGVATDPGHPVLSDLARRLHAHQFAAVSFAHGVRASEIRGLLGTVARETDPDEVPLGLQPPDRVPGWDHAALHPLTYGRLELREGGTPDQARHLWLGLAQAAMGGGSAAGDDPGDPRRLARAIGEQRGEPSYDDAVVGYLLQLAVEVKRPGGGTDGVRRQLTELVREMDVDTLTRLVDLGGDVARRRRFVLDANQSLAVDAVVKVLESAARASEQTISSSMTRLLGKLAAHAEQGGRAVRTQANSALRENVSELIADWELADPNPEEYTALLDTMAHAAPIFQLRAERSEDDHGGPRRIVEMSLEVGGFGPTVMRAVLDLIDGGATSLLVGILDGAPAGSEPAARIWSYLGEPAQVRRVFAGGDVDRATLSRLVGAMGASSVPRLLDLLTGSEPATLRRRVVDLLADLDPAVVGPAVATRLHDAPVSTARSLLTVLHGVDPLPAELDPTPWVMHGDERVRREALPLALRVPAARDRAVTQALADPDERVVRLGLLELRDGVPEVLVPTLVNRVLKNDRSDELRAMGVRCLRDSRSRLVRDTLLGLARGGRSLFGRIRLAPRSIVVLSALEVLHRAWPGDDEAREVIEAAGRSKDRLVRRAVGVR